MSTPFYDLASLVVVPSGYKASKVYAQKPLTTDGQLAFTRSTTATRVNSAGLIQSVAVNVPRLDYLNSTCPRLLLEPQRTNVVLNSETFGASTGTTIVLNNTASPDGYVSADKLAEDTSTGVHLTAFGGSLGGSVDSSLYSVSVFVKAAGRTRFQFFDNNQSSGGISDFDLANGVVISGTGKIENYGNGWYRCIIFPVKDNSTTSNCQLRLISTGTTTSYTGDGTSGVFLWGGQVEAGAYATSYIPTLGASVTRGADAASKTGISSLIGQTEGTLFAEVNLALNGDSAGILAITGVGVTFIYLFTAANTNVLNANVYVSGTQEANMTYTLPSAGTYKIALGYKANDFVLYVNGVQRGSDNSGSVPACSDLYIDSTTYNILPNIKHSQALLFKTRLTNTQLEELTTI